MAAQAQRRRKDLRERSQVDDVGLAERAQRRRELVVVPEQTVGIVLEYRDHLLVGELDQLMPSLEAHAGPRWVREVRHRIDQLGAVAGVGNHVLDHLGQRLDDHSMAIGWHGGESSTCVAQAVKGAGIGRRFDQYNVTRIEKCAGDEVDRLL